MWQKLFLADLIYALFLFVFIFSIAKLSVLEQRAQKSISNFIMFCSAVCL